MSARLTLVCHAPTAATATAAFPADEPLDERGRGWAAEVGRDRFGRAGLALHAPAPACRETATALGLLGATRTGPAGLGPRPLAGPHAGRGRRGRAGRRRGLAQRTGRRPARRRAADRPAGPGGGLADRGGGRGAHGGRHASGRGARGRGRRTGRAGHRVLADRPGSAHRDRAARPARTLDAAQHRPPAAHAHLGCARPDSGGAGSTWRGSRSATAVPLRCSRGCHSRG